MTNRLVFLFITTAYPVAQHKVSARGFQCPNAQSPRSEGSIL